MRRRSARRSKTRSAAACGAGLSKTVLVPSELLLAAASSRLSGTSCGPTPAAPASLFGPNLRLSGRVLRVWIVLAVFRGGGTVLCRSSGAVPFRCAPRSCCRGYSNEFGGEPDPIATAANVEPEGGSSAHTEEQSAVVRGRAVLVQTRRCWCGARRGMSTPLRRFRDGPRTGSAIGRHLSACHRASTAPPTAPAMSPSSAAVIWPVHAKLAGRSMLSRRLSMNTSRY